MGNKQEKPPKRLTAHDYAIMSDEYAAKIKDEEKRAKEDKKIREKECIEIYAKRFVTCLEYCVTEESKKGKKEYTIDVQKNCWPMQNDYFRIFNQRSEEGFNDKRDNIASTYWEKIQKRCILESLCFIIKDEKMTEKSRKFTFSWDVPPLVEEKIDQPTRPLRTRKRTTRRAFRTYETDYF